ncbi:MAG: tetratricopeptide repeat protein [Chloroflexaceae bacterium]|nr:tetratricopeptide repeat protein [Chloroflexaceae bacterium]
MMLSLVGANMFFARSTADTLLAQGQENLRRGDYAPALQAFNQALDVQPDNTAALTGKGQALLGLGDYTEAAKQFEQAIQQDPTNELYVLLGNTYFYHSEESRVPRRKQLLEQAETAYLQALKLKSKSPQALTAMAWNLRMQDNFDESVHYFKESLAIDDKQADAHNGLGWNYLDLGHDRQARDHFEAAVQLDPDFANAFYGLGKARAAMDDIDGAIEAYEKALELEPDMRDAQDALERLP